MLEAQSTICTFGLELGKSDEQSSESSGCRAKGHRQVRGYIRSAYFDFSFTINITHSSANLAIMSNTFSCENWQLNHGVTMLDGVQDESALKKLSDAGEKALGLYKDFMSQFKT